MNEDTDSIRGKVVVIPGASSDIGEAAARLLAARGAKVFLGARRQDRLSAIVADIERLGAWTSTRSCYDLPRRRASDPRPHTTTAPQAGPGCGVRVQAGQSCA